MKLLNVTKGQLCVDNGKGLEYIDPGKDLDVDGRKDWTKNLFVKAGWLGIIEDDKAEKSVRQQDKQSDTDKKEQSTEK